MSSDVPQSSGFEEGDIELKKVEHAESIFPVQKFQKLHNVIWRSVHYTGARRGNSVE